MSGCVLQVHMGKACNTNLPYKDVIYFISEQLMCLPQIIIPLFPWSRMTLNYSEYSVSPVCVCGEN